MKRFFIPLMAAGIVIASSSSGAIEMPPTITLGVREMADVSFCETKDQAEAVARIYRERALKESFKIFKKYHCTTTRTYATALTVVSSWKKGDATMRVLKTQILADDFSYKEVYVLTLLPIVGMREA